MDNETSIRVEQRRHHKYGFQCRSRHHVGNRSTPWCDGGADEYPNSCSACWVKEMKRRGKL